MAKIDPKRLVQRWWRRLAARATKVPKPPGQGEAVFRLPTTHANALAKLTDPALLLTANYRKKTDLTRDGFDGRAHPDIMKFYRAFQKELAKRNIPLYPFQLYRSPEQQRIYYNAGTSKAPPGASPHQYGMAVDMIHLTRSWDLSKKEWAVIGLIGHEVARRCKVKVNWGGDDGPDDKFRWDPAHWELVDWAWRKRNGEGV